MKEKGVKGRTDMSLGEEGPRRELNTDDQLLAEMGYTADLNREFGLLSCLVFGFNVHSYSLSNLDSSGSRWAIWVFEMLIREPNRYQTHGWESVVCL